MANQGGNNISSEVATREYRKGNWTLSETMVLIEAKMMDDERRLMKRIMNSSSGNDPSTSEANRIYKPAELRWKWVEDYCWNKGCYRNQNQCNDKWDNLMRDYKKVREYERSLVVKKDRDDQSSCNNDNSYWKLEKNERKEKSLPSNMLLQVYEALVDVVERRGGHHQPRITTSTPTPTTTTTTTTTSTNIASANVTNLNSTAMVGYNVVNVERPMVVTSVVPLLQHHQFSSPSRVFLPLQPPPIPSLPPPPPPPLPQTAQPPPAPPLPTVGTLTSETSDSDTSEYSDSPAKRRRKGVGDPNAGGGEGPSSGGGGGTTLSASTSSEVGDAITKSTSVIIEAIQASEEKVERRHKELLDLHERRLKIEESNTEINRQGINGLVDAVNNLATSILALASHKNQSIPPP